MTMPQTVFLHSLKGNTNYHQGNGMSSDDNVLNKATKTFKKGNRCFNLMLVVSFLSFWII